MKSYRVSQSLPGRTGLLAVTGRLVVTGALMGALLFGAPILLRSAWAVPPPAGNAGDSKDDKAKTNQPVLTEDNEVKIGRESAEENDKHVQLVTDAALVERVNRIGNELAVIANSTFIKPLWGTPQLKQFKYTFKIVNDKDVNAYSLPGGYIYVNKGLLDYVRSDDELAGVLAHEISHAAHHHMVKLMHEQNKIQNILLPALAGILVATHPSAADIGNVVNAGYLYAIAKINTYGVEAEKDADHSGMLLMTHTKYDPTGLYSFMLRLAADEQRHNYVDMGILRTHPPGEERVEAAKKVLDDLHIPIRLSKVDPTLLVNVAVVKGTSDTPDMAELKIRGVVLCRVIGVDGMTAEQRGQKIAGQLNAIIDTEIKPFEIQFNRDHTKVLVRSISVLTEADAAAQYKKLEELKTDFTNAILMVNQKRQLESAY
ncbi:MAG TPA: M48 family metalloprotease [Chthonomonadaceae bacterium]|nr:M48 family metalloprotease [Chthonomonadaceae bacterium]